MGKALQPVIVDGIEFDALIKSDLKYEAEVPQYPIETGFEVSDGVIIKQKQLDMTLFVTDTPVTWLNRHGSNGRVEQVKQSIQETFLAKKRIEVTTTDETYESMVIQSYTVSKSLEVGYALEIPITLVQVSVTDTKATTIPDSYGKSGTTGVAAGPASTTESEVEVEESDNVKYTLLGGADNALLGGRILTWAANNQYSG